MTEEQKQNEVRNDLAKMLIGSLFCIEQEYKLKDYAFYEHKTSQIGTNYRKRLEALESDIYLKLNGVNRTDDEKKEFYNQLLISSNSMNDMMNCSMNLKNDSQRKYFSDEIIALVNKYNLIEE